jgi:hypothetical protein
MSRRRVLAGVAAAGLVLLTGCGSTVATIGGQPTGTDSTGELNAGLSGPAQAGSSSSLSAGAGAVPGSGAGAGAIASTSSPPTSTSALAGPGSGQASAAGRGPLKIGMLYPTNGAANNALGVTTTASSDPKSVMRALVAGLNKHGGLAGRQLVVDYDAIDATSSDYSTQANAACAHFTQDDPVPVVLDFAFGNAFGMATCLAKHGVADFGHGTSDSVGDKAVGLYAAPDWMTSTRRYPAVISGLHATGYLTSRNKIGVLLENCPFLQRAYTQAVRPEISRLGLNLVDTETLDCTTGFSSAGPASAAVQSAVLRFRSHGVDRVLLVSNYEQVALLLLANSAESQGWRPGYMLSSNAQTEVMRPNIPSGQWLQLHGIGWSPGLDIDDPHQPLPPADRRCLGLIKAGGITVSGWQNTYVANAECSDVFFLDAALRKDGGNAQGSALMVAVESLGTNYVSPGIVEGRTSFGPSRRDGPAAAAPFGYVAACKCLKYTGRAFTVS